MHLAIGSRASADSEAGSGLAAQQQLLLKREHFLRRGGLTLLPSPERLQCCAHLDAACQVQVGWEEEIEKGGKTLWYVCALFALSLWCVCVLGREG